MNETVTPQAPETPDFSPKDNFAAINEMQNNPDYVEQREAAQAAYRLFHAPEPEEAPKSHAKRNKAIASGLLVATAATGIAVLATEQGGSHNGESRGTADTTISSVTLNPDANIRFDPYVGEGDNDNNVLHLGAQITIDVNHDARVLDGTNNGTWIGIPLDEVKTVVPDINTSDKDGIVWVNEQGIKEIKHAQSETK